MAKTCRLKWLGDLACPPGKNGWCQESPSFVRSWHSSRSFVPPFSTAVSPFLRLLLAFGRKITHKNTILKFLNNEPKTKTSNKTHRDKNIRGPIQTFGSRRNATFCSRDVLVPWCTTSGWWDHKETHEIGPILGGFPLRSEGFIGISPS